MDEYEVIKIAQHNIHRYASLMPEDISSRIGRRPFTGMVVEKIDGEGVEAAMVWRERKGRKKVPSEWEIMWIMCNDPAAFKEMIEEFKAEAVRKKAAGVYFELADPEPGMREVLSGEGFVLREEESRTLMFTLDEIAREERFSEYTNKHVKPLKEVRVRSYITAINMLNKLVHGGILDDIRYLPTGWYDDELSCAVMKKDHIMGLLLVSARASGTLYVDLLYVFPGASKATVLLLIQYALRSARRKYPGNTPVRVERSNSQVTRIVKAFFPEKRGEIVVKGSLTDGLRKQ